MSSIAEPSPREVGGACVDAVSGSACASRYLPCSSLRLARWAGPACVLLSPTSTIVW